MEIKDRIRELRRVPAGELRPNPRNWRTHPPAQQNALRGILSEIGYAGALSARELPDGSLMLIDGHLRTEITPDQAVPVLVLDVTEAEADKLLATIDPLAAMAEADAIKLDALLKEIDTDSEALQEMLVELQPPPMLENSEPPDSISAILSQIESIKSQRSLANNKTEVKNDTEKYLVVVYRSREEKEAALAAFGLPIDERYISASALTIKPRYVVKPMQTNGRQIKSSPAKNSGAAG